MIMNEDESFLYHFYKLGGKKILEVQYNLCMVVVLECRVVRQLIWNGSRISKGSKSK
jgi:hypothetical protein